MKKFLALLTAMVLCLSLAACGGSSGGSSGGSTPAGGGSQPADSGSSTSGGSGSGAATSVKVGLICIGDENDQGYTYNFIRGKDAATEALAAKGIDVDWSVKWNIGENDSCEEANLELAEEGCQLIINNSFGFEDFMLKVAPDYPDIEFVSCTNQASWGDDLPNTHNAFANIYEGRYLAGVAAGMKMQEMIDNGEITADQAVIGYVGAYSFAEVISGFTSYFLGARSVCPSVTMKVQFVGSWSDATAEGNAADALADMGCVMISQHSDNTTPATTAQTKGVYHTGYNNDMTGVAPEASIIGTRIDWSVYFEYIIEAVANGQEFEQDWCHGMDMGAVVMTDLNEAIAAEGTAEKLAEVEEQIRSGALQVFDTSTFTISGQPLTSALALDTDGDYAPDSEEAVFDGAFHESYFQSAPYFALSVDGIEWLNSAF
ncbi:MAG: BMP family ABC transporter substrate-binding protein [Oscillibacter sp.]|nr:BMP family ABC transporter substrate-binding protein [Oscillibacter sp.]